MLVEFWYKEGLIGSSTKMTTVPRAGDNLKLRPHDSKEMHDYKVENITWEIELFPYDQPARVLVHCVKL